MDPVTHGRVAGTAKALGMDLNGLLNLLIREGLIRYEMEAQMLREPKTLSLLERWRYLNPTRETWEFFSDYFRSHRGLPVLFEDGKRYLLFEDGFGEEPSSEEIERAYRPPDTPSNEDVDDTPF
jgi:hypothetical protein